MLHDRKLLRRAEEDAAEVGDIAVKVTMAKLEPERLLLRLILELQIRRVALRLVKVVALEDHELALAHRQEVGEEEQGL